MKNLLMNQMNPMNLLRGVWYIKKYFSMQRGSLGQFFGSFGFIGLFLAHFDIININKLIFIVVRMNQMYLDEPRASFRRFFCFGRFTFSIG